MWRLFQLFALRRGNGDMMKWLGQVTVHYRRMKDTWMDLLPRYEKDDPRYIAQVDELNHRRGLYMQPPLDLQDQTVLMTGTHQKRTNTRHCFR